MKQFEAVKNCYNQTADNYANAFFEELKGKPLDRLLLQRFVDQNKDKGVIADLGCGPGQTTLFLKNCGASDLLGIDLSEAMVKKAMMVCPPDIPFETGDMSQLKYPKEQFGGIIAFYAIVHFEIDELDRVFREIFRVLKKGGQFLFSFHAGTGMNTLEEFLDHKVNINFHYFDADIVLDKLLNLGFQFEDCLVRYPYPDKEYPSKRAYFLVSKSA